MFKDHLIFSNNIYDAAKQVLEAYVVDPNQKYAAPIRPSSSETGPNDSTESRLQQGQKRADVLGKMFAAHSYEGVNDHERDAIARIIADTQTSRPHRSDYAYGNFQSYRPSERQAGTEASGQHLRLALGAIKRLDQDPKLAEHLTKTIASELPDTMVDRAYMADMYADQDFPSFGTREARRLETVARKNATDLPIENSPSAVTSQFGQRMFNTFPGDENELGDKRNEELKKMLSEEIKKFKPEDIKNTLTPEIKYTIWQRIKRTLGII
jgi:hypothetical protein